MNDETDRRTTGSATTTIQAPIGDVFAAVTDVSQTGEWSPECVAGRWVGGVDAAKVGALPARADDGAVYQFNARPLLVAAGHPPR